MRYLEIERTLHIEFFGDLEQAARGNDDYTGEDHLQREISDAKSIHDRCQKHRLADHCCDRKQYCAQRQHELRWHAFGVSLKISPVSLGVFFAPLQNLHLSFEHLDAM